MKLKKLILGILLSLVFPITANAASTAYVDISSSKSTIVTGDTFYVYVEVSSSSYIGAYEYTLSYDSSKVKLTNSPSSCTNTYCVWSTTTGKDKSSTYTFTFKAVGTGSSTISIKSYSFIDYNEKKMTPSISSKTVKTLTQEELEASYSKNNYLSSLKVDKGSISPKFNKDTLNYTLTVDSTVDKIKIEATKADSKASISGIGTKKVTEGDNVFKIVVTAENGSKRTYKLTVTVKELHPITVTMNEKEYTIIKKKTLLKMPNNYKESTIKIEEETIPVFIGEVTGYTLIGLRDDESNINLYIYDEENNTYTPYIEYDFSNTSLQLLDEKINIPEGYTEYKEKIKEEEITVYKDNKDSEFALVYALNLTTGNKTLYKIDLEENTVQRFNERDLTSKFNKLSEEYQDKLIILGGSFVAFIVLVILISLISSLTRKAKRRKKLEQKKLEEQKRIEESKKKKHSTEETQKKKTKKKKLDDIPEEDRL